MRDPNPLSATRQVLFYKESFQRMTIASFVRSSDEADRPSELGAAAAKHDQLAVSAVFLAPAVHHERVVH